MQRNRKTFIVSFLFISTGFFSETSGFAQQVSGYSENLPDGSCAFFLGITGGINFVNYRTSAFTTEGAIAPFFFNSQNGSGTAPFFGVSAELPVSDYSNHFITLGFYYDMKSGTFNSDNYNTLTVIAGDTSIGAGISHLKASLSYLTMSVGYKYNFTHGPIPLGLGIQLNGYIGVRLLNSFDMTQDIRTRLLRTNQTSSFVETVTSGIDGSQKYRIGVRGQFTYDLPLDWSYFITPFLGYDFPVTKVDNTNRSWIASSIYLGVSFHFLIGGYPGPIL